MKEFLFSWLDIIVFEMSVEGDIFEFTNEFAVFKIAALRLHRLEFAPAEGCVNKFRGKKTAASEVAAIKIAI